MAENQLQIIVQQSAEVTKNVASIKTDITNAIRENNTSLQNCIKAGEALLAQSGEMSDELDAQIASFIKKASVTQKAMTERRKGVTQVFDLVKSGFTKMENLLDKKSEESIIYKLQKKRDEYAAYKLEIQRKAEEERKRLARIEAAKTQLHDDVISVCNQIVTEKTSLALDQLNDKFRLLTIDNAKVVKKEIEDFETKLDLAHILADRKPSVSQEVSAEDVSAIMRAAYKECVEGLIKSYADSVSQAKQDILDTFDSKIAELQEIKKTADEAERKRKEAELKAAEEAAEKERQAKADEEKKKRDEEERLRKAQSQSQSLFDQTSSVASPVKAKVSHHIEIDDPKGFLAIIQMWWTHEGSTLTLEELKKKLSFMVKTCEKLKNKDDISVVDDNVRYVEDIVAK